MRPTRRDLALSAAALSSGGLAAPVLAHAQPKPRGLTVVELYTSQLCPGCPIADAYLIELAKRPNLIPLSFSVTHYDRGELKDPFGKVEFNHRQFAYAGAFHHDNAFTPEVVVNGKADAPGLAIDFVEELLVGAELDGPAVTPGREWVEVAEGAAPAGGADVWVAHYDPRIVTSPIRGLEDRRLAHTNIVRGLYLLGEWRGGKQRYDAPPLAPGMRQAAVVQTANTGPILSAARA